MYVDAFFLSDTVIEIILVYISYIKPHKQFPIKIGFALITG